MLGNIKQNLYRSWTDLGNKLNLGTQETEHSWKVLVRFYEQPHRSYHNFNHLAQMFALTVDIQTYISDPVSFHLAIWFHDLVYKPLRNDNELISAEKAKTFMKSWNVSKQTIELVTQYIHSTAKHLPLTANEDVKLFLDVDLSILGSAPNTYSTYIQAIRHEYKIYPDPIYKYGRKKILIKFLERPYIYFSDILRERFEEQARANMEKELLNMSK